MKNVKAAFGNRPAEDITPSEIETWLEGQAEWTLATKNRYIALMKLVYRLAERAQRIKYNPARLVRQQKEDNARIRWLTEQEETDLRSVIRRDCPERMPEFDIALHTGMRRSEQYGMQWEHVDFLNQLITIPDSKHGAVRYVQMNSRVAAILSGLKSEALGTEPKRVFSLVGPRSWFEPAVKAANLTDFSWHCLRHTFISRLVMVGVDLRTVQELAAHKSISMTCRYAHLASGHQQTAIEKLVPKAKQKRAKKEQTAGATRTATRQNNGAIEQRHAVQ